MQSSERPPPVRLFAADVAASYARAAGATERVQEEITWVAMEVGMHLSERGRAAEWDRIDPSSLAAFIQTGCLEDRLLFLRHLSSMLSWLAAADTLERGCVVATLEGLRDALAPCPKSQKILRRALAQLATVVLPPPPGPRRIPNLPPRPDALFPLQTDETATTTTRQAPAPREATQPPRTEAAAVAPGPGDAPAAAPSSPPRPGDAPAAAPSSPPTQARVRPCATTARASETALAPLELAPTEPALHVSAPEPPPPDAA